MDSSQWPSLSTQVPEIEEALKTIPNAVIELDDPAELPPLRPTIDAGIKAGLDARLDFSSIKRSDISVPFRDGFVSVSKLYQPETPVSGGSPLVVLVHGGGWVLADAEIEGGSALPLVKDFGCVVVSIEYRRAPEHQFPGPVNDSWDGLQWCAANASTLGADPSKGFLVGGSSAGGNLSAVLQHLARDTNLNPPLTGAWLAYPATVSVDALPEKFKHEHTSIVQNANAPALTSKSVAFMRKCYNPDPASELFNPFNWPSGHSGLCRTVVHVCGQDPIRDDGLLYERELRKEGTETMLFVYPGAPHGLDLFLPMTSQARKFEEDRRVAFRWLLRQ